MQMKKLDFRKSHRSSYSHLPRMASFIGTSNHKDLLTDPRAVAVIFVPR